MADAAEDITVIIDDPDDSVRVDQETGNVEVDQPDGGVVVQFGAARWQGKEDEGFDANLAKRMDSASLAAIANELSEQIKADDQSRQEYLAIRARGMDLLGIKLQEPKSSVGDSAAMMDGVSTVTNPLLLDAILHGWANATGEFLPDIGPMKVRDDGDETAAKDELAEQLEKSMNHYLTYRAPEYYPDTSHMLLWGTYFGGSGFKKIYRCPMRRRPVSESVDCSDLIVSDATKDLRACSRITHQIKMRPSVMKRMMLLGAYLDTELPTPGFAPLNAVQETVANIQGIRPSTRPEDQPYILWESQCELDLPEFAPTQFKNERIPLPYIVTMDKDSQQILSIRRDWKEKDEDAGRRRMYVKWPYVPGPGFYGTGLLHILGNASAAMTAAWREALDTGMFANFPGGLIAKLAGRQNTSDFRLSPGEFEPVETNGLPINQVVTGLPYKDVTPGLLKLMEMITAQCKSLGGAADIPSADGLANIPVGTMMAQIEQATKVVMAAHRGMHTAQSEEFELIIELFRETPEDFWRGDTTSPPNFWTRDKLEQAFRDVDLVPRSDPNTPSHIHRIGKAVGISQLFMNPIFATRLDPDEGLKRILQAMREDPKGLLLPPPDPNAQQQPNLGDQAKMVTAQAKVQGNKIAAADTMVKAQGKQAEIAQKGQLAAQQQAGQKDIETMRLARELVIHQHDADQGVHQRRMDMADHSIRAAELGHNMTMDTAQFKHDAAMDVQEAADRAKTPSGE